MIFEFDKKEMDEMAREAADEYIKKNNEKYNKCILEGSSIFPLVDKKSSVMDDDNLYSEDESLHDIDYLVYAVSSACLEYCNAIGKKILANEEFYTERCFLGYENKIYEIEEISGQGTFTRITLTDKKDASSCIEWQDVIKFCKDNIK